MVFKDSAKFWFPRIAKPETTKLFSPNILIPNTVFVDYNEESIFGPDSYSALDSLFLSVESAIRYEIAADFAFIRTDVTSAKHLGIDAIKAVIAPKSTLNFALRKTLRHAEIKTYLSKRKSSAIMVREWINVKHESTAFGGLPIGREWRIFADQNRVLCANNYWPKRALEGYMDNHAVLPKEWYRFWTPGEIMDAAFVAARAMGEGYWSVDFVEDVNGKFWLVDMATGENSYHHEDCSCELNIREV